MTTNISWGLHTYTTWWSTELCNAKSIVVHWELRRVQRISGMLMDIGIQEIIQKLTSDQHSR